jgi:Prokaryotic phospholipase A2
MYSKKLKTWGKTALVCLFAGGLTLGSVGVAQASPNTQGESQAQNPLETSPILEPILVESAQLGTEFAIQDLKSLAGDYELVTGSDGSIQVNGESKNSGVLSDPFAIDANGTRVPSVYKVEGLTVSQSISVDSKTAYPVTLAPALVRTSESDDGAIVAAYHDFLTELPKLSQPESGVQARSVGVGIPSNYVYNTKHARVELHDYCTLSPDEWFNANFRGACAKHDMCIEGNLGKTKAVQKTLRAGCDKGLATNLASSCTMAYTPGLKRTTCTSVAATYYAVVSVKTWTT